jgi:hypothetical protein
MRLFLLVPLLGFFLVSCQSAFRLKPENFPQKLVAPAVSLTTEDGSDYNFAAIYGEHKATVVIFWQSKCPCVKRYQDRITELFSRYGQDGVAMTYVFSNSDQSFDEALKEYKKRKSPLPFMHDQGGQLAKVLDARGTPTAALFNQAGDLVYMGWIDNERYTNENGRIAYLEDAIKDLLASQPVKTPTSPMFGCPIN